MKRRRNKKVRPSKHRLVRHLSYVVIPTLVVVLASVGLMYWRRQTQVDIVATVNQLSFTVERTPSGYATILDKIVATRVSVTEFDSVHFSPDSLEVAEPSRYDLAKDTYTDDAWRPVRMNQDEILVRGADPTLHAGITLKGESDPDALLRASPLQLEAGSKLTLAVSITKKRTDDSTPIFQSAKEGLIGGNVDLLLSVSQTGVPLYTTIGQPFWLIAQHCTIEGLSATGFESENSVTYRVRLRGSSPTMQITGGPGGIGLGLKVPRDKIANLFYRDGISVRGLAFLSDNPQAASVKTSLVDGEKCLITYPSYPKLAGVEIQAPDLIQFAGDDHFVIKEIGLVPDGEGVRIHVVGTVDKLVTGLPGAYIDRRLSAFESLMQNALLAAVLAVICWVIPVSVVVYKFVMEVKKGNQP